MAKFTFTIESDEMGEMSSLLGKLFAGHAEIKAAPAPKPKPAPEPVPSTLTHPDDEEVSFTGPVEVIAEVQRRTRRTQAQIAADNAAKAPPAVEPKFDTVEDEVEPEVEPEVDVEPAELDATLDMVRAAGSKAMGLIKASGVSEIFKQHGGGAETFGSLQPDRYNAVYAALVEAVN